MLKFTDSHIGHRDKWTSDELQFLRDNYKKLGPTEVSRVLKGRTFCAVKGAGKKLGLCALGRYVDVEFFKIWSERMAWCLGLVATDGWLDSKEQLIDGKRCNENVGIDSTDYEIIEKFVNFTGSTYAVGEKRGRARKKHWYNVVTNKNLYYILLGYGLKERKSLDLQFPKDYPDEWMPGYVRGVSDGDGYIGIRTQGYLRTAIGMSSKYFIYDLDEYLTRVLDLSEHTICVEREPRKEPYYKLNLSGDNARKLCRWMYHDNMHDAYLTRKYNVWLEYKRKKGL